MIKVEDLHKSFDGLDVLRGATLHIDSGEILALIGMSGYGKSVLLKHISGLMKPDKGRVLVDQVDIASLKGKGLSRFRNRLGFVFQGGALFDSMTVFENVAFPLREKTKMSEQEIGERVRCELEQVGLTEAARKYPSQISGGMIRRASLARALVEEPAIMLFDEPTTGLDPVIGNTILNLIDACHKRLKFTGIIITHDIPQVFRIVDKVALLHEGVIVMQGSPEEIEQTTNPVVKQFLSGKMNDAKAL